MRVLGVGRLAPEWARIVAGAISLTGCSVDLVVPVESKVGCTSDAECPSGQVCQSALGLCRTPAQLDNEPPRLVEGSVLLDPQAGKRGTIFSLQLDADEPLRGAPQVVVQAGTSPRPFVLAQQEGTRFVFNYTALGDEPEEQWPVLVTLEDLSGNVANGIGAASIRFDFSAPRLVGAPQLAPSQINAGAAATLAFVLDEDAAAQPIVTMTDRDPPFTVVAWTPNADPLGADDRRTFRFSYSPMGAQLNATFLIAISAVDLAGNATEPPLAAGELVVDTELPFVQSVEPVLYERDAGNPLAAIAAMRNGVKATVVFRTNEPLAATPLVRAVCSGTPLALTRRVNEDSATLFSYSLTLSAVDAAPSGVCALQADLADLAGNHVDAAPLGAELRLDRDLPSAASAVNSSLVKHLRVPWGAPFTSGVGGQYVVASDFAAVVDPSTSGVALGAFAADGDSVVEVRVYTAEAAGQRVGIIERDVSGWRVAPLFATDSRELWLAVIDEAGNESPDRVRVRSTEWVATLGHKVAGSSFENPHRFLRRQWFTAALDGPGAIEGDATLGIDSVGATAAPWAASDAGAASWRHLAIAYTLTPRMGAAMAYDSARGRTVMFGGSSLAADCDDTLGSTCAGPWEWDGVRWTQITPQDPEGDGNPLPTTGAAMVFDSVRNVVVMFGGDASLANPDPLRPALWEWNGVSWARRCDGVPASDTCGSALPPARTRHAMAFDSLRGQVIVFGGCTSSGCAGGDLSDTWEWDGSLWQKRCDGVPASDVCPTHPIGREGAAMAFDPYRGKTTLNGGLWTSWPYPLETWEWDGSTWERRCDGSPVGDTCTEPVFRYMHGMAFDEQRRKIVMFGGQSGYSQPSAADVWEWDGTTWDKRCDGSPVGDTCPAMPSARRGYGMVYDAMAKQIVLFAGRADADCGTGSVWCDDTWSWDGAAWRQVGPFDAEKDGNPSARFGHAMAYDENAKEVLLFGGGNDSGIGVGLDDTWAWNGRDWTLRCSACTSLERPPARAFHAMTYSPTAGKVVLFGGKTKAMRCDYPGPTRLQDTWEWTGTIWDHRCDGTPAADTCSGAPVAREKAVLTRDAGGNAMLVGGYAGSGLNCGTGFAYCAQAWVWNGADWAVDASVPQPSGRTGPGLAFDGASSLVLGGADGSECNAATTSGDMWLSQTGTWTAPTPLLMPENRWDSSLVTDESSGRVVLFGGYSDQCLPQHCEKLWTWKTGTWSVVDITDVEGDGSPLARRHHAMAYDKTRGQLLLFGGATVMRHPIYGWTSTWRGGDTWALDLGAAERPAELADFVYGAAGTDGAETLDDIEVGWYAAGQGEGSSPASDGAVLYVWSLGRWVPLASHQTPPTVAPVAYGPAEPWLLHWSCQGDAQCAALSTAARARRFFQGNERQVHLAVAPAARNGAGYATIETDYLEVRIRYSLP